MSAVTSTEPVALWLFNIG